MPWIVNGVPYGNRMEAGAPSRARRRGRLIKSRAELFFEQLALMLLAAAAGQAVWLLVIGLVWLFGAPQ